MGEFIFAMNKIDGGKSPLLNASYVSASSCV
jgi:hypothetical protein